MAEFDVQPIRDRAPVTSALRHRPPWRHPRAWPSIPWIPMRLRRNYANCRNGSAPRTR